MSMSRRSFKGKFIPRESDLLVPAEYTNGIRGGSGDLSEELYTSDVGVPYKCSMVKRTFLPVVAGLAVAASMACSSDDLSPEDLNLNDSAGFEECIGTPRELSGHNYPIGPRIMRLAREDDLSVLRDRVMVDRFLERDLLVYLDRNENPNFYVSDIPFGYSTVRPWTRLFVERISKQFRDKFGKRMRITSATRDIKYQNWLRRRNGNAARGVSSHNHGNTVDFSRIGWSCEKRNWLSYNQILELQKAGMVEAVVESNNATHVAVKKRYVPWIRDRLARNGQLSKREFDRRYYNHEWQRLSIY